MRIVILTALLSGCTLVSDINGQKCETDADCDKGRMCSAVKFCLLPEEGALECSATKPCASGDLCVSGQCELEEVARWGCIKDLPEAPMTGSAKSTLRMRVRKHGGASGETLPVGTAVTAIACLQASCDKPIGPFKVDVDGSVDVVVAQGFQGLVKFTAAGLRDTLYQLQSPVNVDVAAPLDVVMFSDADVTALAAAANVKLDAADRAVVVFQVLDCVPEPSSDVSVTALDKDPMVDIFYLAPDQTAQRDATATSRAGVAVATDVAVGTARFNLIRKGGKDAIDSPEVATLTRTVTYVPYQFGK